MEPVFFVMAILGCGDDGMACQTQRTMPTRYESASACQAAIAGALERNTDLDFPVVGASCVQNGRRFADSVPAPVNPRS